MNKKKILFLLPLIGAMSLAGCKQKEETPCSHADANNDFTCDLCGAQLATSSVELDTSSVQKLFSLGETFNSTGLKVIATSEIGSKKELSSFTVSEPDMSTVGDKTVTVTYGTGEADKKSYSINVSYWAAMDLAVFEAATFLGSEAGVALPFLPGHNMRVEYEIDEDYTLTSWSIVADNCGQAELDSLLDKYLDVSHVEEIEQEDVTFEFVETAIDGEGFHDLEHVEVLRMSPYYEYSQGINVRQYNIDEYYVLGLTEENELVVEVRYINAVLEESFAKAEKVCDGDAVGFYTSDGLQDNVPELVGENYSEIAEQEFAIPSEVPTDENSGFFPGNLASIDPLDESLDKYDLAWDMCFTKGTAAMKEAYEAALVADGFEKVENSYVKDDSEGDDFVGRMEIVPYFDDTEGRNWFGYYFYYNASETYDYVTKMHPLVVSFMEYGLEVTDFELDSDYYSSSNEEIDAWYKVDAPEAIPAEGEEGEPGYVPAQSSEEQACKALAAKLVTLGFEVTLAPEESKYYGKSDCWKAEFTDYSHFNITAYVFPAKEGKCEIGLEIFKYYAFTIEDVVAAIFGSETPTYAEGKYSLIVEGTITSIVTPYMSYSAQINQISSIDYGVFYINGEDDTDGVYFSGLTKDGKIVYTVYVTPAQEAGEFVVTLDAEIIGAKEELMRKTLNGFSSNGAIRHYNYKFKQDGSIETTTMYFVATPEAILSDVENYVLDSTFVDISGETGPTIYSNGSITYSLTFGEFVYGTTTYLTVVITIADVPAEA